MMKLMEMLKVTVLSGVLCASFSAVAGQVNINKADAKTIAEQLTGIGMVKAAAIIKYRDENGAFKAVSELASVKGISDKTIETNRDSILLSSK